MGELIPATVQSIQTASQLGEAELLSEWLRGKSLDTQRAYRGDIARIAQHFGAPSAPSFLAAFFGLSGPDAHLQVLRWKNDLLERLAPASVNRALSALKSVCKLARQLGKIDWTLSIEGVKARAYKNTRGPGREAYLAMLASLDLETPLGLRDQAILRLLHDRGLRCGEVARLDLEDYDREQPEVLVLGKGRREKEALGIPQVTAAALDAWVETRGIDPGPLFVRLDSGAKGLGRLSGRSVRRAVDRIGEAAGVGHVWPHGLRHTAITTAIEVTGGDVAKVREFSRHSKVETVIRYYDAAEDVGTEISEQVAGD